MKNIHFEDIKDAYQIVQGAKIKSKADDEVYELGEYDANKRGYVVFPFEDGILYTDFSMIMAEKEMMTNYLIEPVKTSPFQRAA